MANGIRTGETRGFNNGRSSKFREGSQVRQTPEKGRRTYRPKRCGNNNENNNPKTLRMKKAYIIHKIPPATKNLAYIQIHVIYIYIYI